jgi:hypothetical protein
MLERALGSGAGTVSASSDIAAVYRLIDLEAWFTVEARVSTP